MKRCLFWVAILLFLITGVAFSQPYPFDFVSANPNVDTLYRIMHNATPVPYGMLVQVIKPGANGVLDPPLFTGTNVGNVGGDDALATSFAIGDGIDSSSINANGLFSVTLTAILSNPLPNQLLSGQPFYIRVFETVAYPNSYPGPAGVPYCEGGPYTTPANPGSAIWRVQVNPSSANPTWYPQGLIHPNGGENLAVGANDTIRWNTGLFTGNVRIDLNRSYPSTSWTTISASSSNSGSATWTVSAPTTQTARIRIVSIADTSIFGVSDFNFTITNPSLTVNYPNGGEVLVVNRMDSIVWNNIGSGSVRIDLNRDYPTATSWTTLFASVPASAHSITWNPVTGPPTTTARIRIVAISDTTLRDESDADFSIVQPSITLVHPTGTDTAKIGIADTIQWTSANISGTVRIDLNRAYPSGVWSTLAVSRPNSGMYVWYPGLGDATSTARIRVVSESDTAVSGMSANSFIVRHPRITMGYPFGGEQFVVGQNINILWHVERGLTGTVQIRLSTTGSGGPFTVLFGNLPTTDTAHAWTVPNSPTTQARILVRSLFDTTATDGTDSGFTISTTGVNEHSASVIPEAFSLQPAYPNPFNSSVTLKIGVPYNSDIQLRIFNVLGQQVTLIYGGRMNAGYHRFIWNAGRYASGNYFVKMEAPGYVECRMIQYIR